MLCLWKFGNYARDFEQRGDKALLAAATDIDVEDEKNEFAYTTSNELVLFAQSHVLLDNQASVSIFSNRDLLTNVKRSDNHILINGVQANAKGVRVDQGGNFNEMDHVYYSKNALTYFHSLRWSMMLQRSDMIRGNIGLRYNQKEATTYTVSVDRAFLEVKVGSTYVT